MIPFPYRTANKLLPRIKGLVGAGKNTLPLFLPRCHMIHTWGMRFWLDLAWVDQNGQVLRIDRSVRRCRFRRCPGAYGVFEFPPGSFPANLGEGSIIPLKETDGGFLTDESGQALVEMALMMPFLLLFIFGFLQLSLAISAKQKLTHTVNYAVQAGSLTNNDLQVTGAVEEFYEPGEISIAIKNTSASTGQEIDSDARRYNDIITVQLIQAYGLSIPFFDTDLITLEGEASARVLCNETSSPFTCS